jgi:ketosteroid isomerase-like protein
MSQNVDLVRGLYLPGDTDLVGVFGDDAQANAIAGLLASLADADYEFIDHDLPDLAGGATGVDGFVAAWRRFLDDWESFYLAPVEFIESQDQVVVIARMRGCSKGKSIPFEGDRAAVWTLRDGKILRIEQYADPGDARAAAGLTNKRSELR